MVKISKRYQAARQVADLSKPYPLEEAISLLRKMPPASFDETVELAVHLLVDPKQSSQMVRGTVNLPHGSGKKVRVLVFTENAQEALDAGADYAGLGDYIKRIQDENWLEFDVALATPDAMKEVRKIARIIGPRGLMPNPRAGTVTTDIPGGIQAVKAGRVEFKMDKTANVAVVVGKRSFTVEQLRENIDASIDVVGKSRPEGYRGRLVKSMAISSSMSPSVRLDPAIFARF